MSSILEDTLSLSVPIRIAELEQAGGPSESDIEKVRANLSTITGAIFFGGHDGKAATEFNAVSDALAILAFVDGGVSFAGLRFEAKKREEVRL